MSQNIQSYFPPYFKDKDRLVKIQKLFPDIDRMYQQYAEESHFPGYAYGIVLDGQLVHVGSGGFIDLERKIPATSKSMFRVASMTKSFTAMAVLKLRDEGKLKLDDPVFLYIPQMQQQLTKDSPAMTIRDLLIHCAGFPTDDPWADRKLDIQEEELIALLKKGITFSNATGTVFEYSNLGYAILGYIIKKITGMAYGKYINTQICQPIGMNEVFWEFTEIPNSQLAHGYRLIYEKWEEEKLLQDGAFGAMGGMITSVESFSRYIALHQFAWPARDDKELKVIKRSSMREMHQPWKFKKLEADFKYASGRVCAQTSAYGYGLNWLKDSLGRVFVGHSGGLPGFGSNWLFMPEYGLAVVSFANITYANTFKVNLNVLDKLVVESELISAELPPSRILLKKQAELLKILPYLENVVASGIFAENFFLDYPIEEFRKKCIELFTKAGQIISIDDMIAQNQLSGSFILKGEKADLCISFSLTPENPNLIQQAQVKEFYG